MSRRNEDEVEVRLPSLLVMRLKVLMQRHRRARVTQAMVEAEIVRRLRVSFTIDELIEEHER